jgi:hypothetical protein
MAASRKRRARLPSMHDVAARSLLVLPFASVSAGAALLGAPLLALVAGFVAVALVIDFIFPVTGFLRIDSQHAFQRLAWQRRRQGLANRSRGRDGRRLELLPSRLEQTARRRHLGIQPIPLDSIVGTTEPQKAVDFDHAFRPPSWSRGRWELMWIARRRGDSLPPISVYRLHGRHFVIDGHHRVSVENSLDAASIDADTIELIPLGATADAPNHLPRTPTREPLARSAAAMHTDEPDASLRSPNPTEHAAWGPLGWRAVLLFLAAGLVLTLLSGTLGPVAGYVLIIGACALIGHGLGIPVQTGLKDHRQ